MRKTSSGRLPRRDAPHLPQVRPGLVFGLLARRLARERVDMLRLDPAPGGRAQRPCPSGGVEQARAIERASRPPSSLVPSRRSPPRHGPEAAARPSSTRRRRRRRTVARPTSRASAIRPSGQPGPPAAPSASGRIPRVPGPAGVPPAARERPPRLPAPLGRRRHAALPHFRLLSAVGRLTGQRTHRITADAALAAFSGTVIDPEPAGALFTETAMNDGITERELPERFASDDYQVLIVAENVPDRLRPAAAAHDVRRQAPRGRRRCRPSRA